MGLAAVCATAIVWTGAGPAAAGVINVDTTADVTAVNAQCSLREALTSANTNSNALEPNCEAGVAGQDFITLLQAGTYTLLGTAGEDGNVTGDLDYTGNGPVHIQGPVDSTTGIPTATIDAPPSDRIIDVPSITGASGGLYLDQVTLTDGRALGAGAEGDGGAIRFAVTNSDFGLLSTRITGSRAARNGGAISYETGDGVFGNIEIGFSELSGNAAGTQGPGNGGAIWTGVSQPLPNDPLIYSSTFAGNSASGVGGAVALDGLDHATLRFRNSTMSGNSANGAGSAVAYSGAGDADSFFEFSTVADNTSAVSHGAIAAAASGQDFFLRGSIISGNTGVGVPLNCSGPGQFVSEGHNVESANTCSLVPANPDLINTDPLLAPLAISTVAGAWQTARTRGLYDGSPAADFVPRTPPDQCGDDVTDGGDARGMPRPGAPAGRCDAGAFEGTVGPKPLPPPANPAPSAPVTPKKCKKGRKLKKGKCVKKKRRKRSG